jgi:hypothetical protein
MEFLNFGVELVEDGAKRARQGIVVGEQRGPVRPKNAQIELGVEEGDVQPVAGRGIPMGLRNTMNQTFEAQPPKVVGHLRGGVRVTEKRFDGGPQVVVAKPVWQMRERAKGLEDRHDPRVAEAQRGDALAACDRGVLYAIERVLRQHTVVAEPFDFEDLAIDWSPRLRRCGSWATAFRTLKSIGLLIVVSVRRARCSLKYCFTCDDLYSMCRLGSTPSVMTRVRYP